MRKARMADKERAVSILMKTFDQVDGVRWLVEGKNKERRLKALSEYAFYKSLWRDGVYLSDDNTGVALFFQNSRRGPWYKELWNELHLVWSAFEWIRLPEILARESYRSKLRPHDQDYYYFWMFGVVDEGKGKGAGFELKNGLLSKAEDEKLPVYAETSIKQNCVVYQRMGFTLYHFWEANDKKNRLWFLKKEVRYS